METRIAHAGPPPPATRCPRSGADGGKLAASPFADDAVPAAQRTA
jgi:hypothetical protein